MRIDYNDPDVKKAIKNRMKGMLFPRQGGQPAASYIGDDLFTISGGRKLSISYTDVPSYVKAPFTYPLENK